MNTVKKSWLKSVLTVFTLVLSIFVIAACEKTVSAQEVVDAAKGNLKVVYASGDSKDSVTKDITLPTSLASDQGSISVSWVSNNTSVIAINGATAKVTRPEADTQVTLTATLSLDDAKATVPFIVTVKKVDVNPQELLDALKLEGVQYDEATQRYTTDKDIALVTNLGGFTVAWTSSNPAIIANDGKVTQPAWDASNQLVTLTAKIGTAEKDFRIIVLKLAEKPVSAKLADAANALLIPGTTDGVSNDLQLAATAGTEGVTVTWASSNLEIISNDGKVTRPEEATVVTMTATLSLEGQSIIKEFDLTVLAAAESHLVADIADAFAWIQGNTTEENRNLYIKLVGVTVQAKSGDGFLVADESGVMFIYAPNSATRDLVEVGDVIDVFGNMANYNAVLQMQGNTEKPIKIVENKTASAHFVEAESLTGVSAYIAAMGANNPEHKYDLANPVVISKFKISAKVLVQASSEGNYNTFLVDPTFNGTVNSTANSAMTLDALMIYYNSNIAAIRLFNGLEVELEFWLYSRRTDRNIYTIIFTETAEEITPKASNEEILGLVESGIKSGIAGEYSEATTIALPTSLLGATISYASESSLVNVQTGALSMPASGQETVTITATITRNGETKVSTISIKLGEMSVSTIASVKSNEVANGSKVRIEGVVTTMTISDNFENGHMMLEDATGAIVAFRVAKSDLLQIKVGDLVIIEGNKETSVGMIRIAQASKLIRVVSSNNEVTPLVVASASELTAEKAGKLVSVTGYLKQAITTVGYGQNYVLVLADGSEVTARSVSDNDSTDGDLNSLSVLNGLAAGTQVTIVTALDWYNGAQLALYKSAQVTAGEKATDEILAEIAAATDLKLPAASAELIANLNLPTSAIFGTVITWTSSNEAVISNAGVVTRAEANTVVTLTYVAKIGDALVKEGTIEFTVLGSSSEVKVPELLYSYDFIDGGSSANNGYANTNLATNVSYAANNPGGGAGTTPWIANWANLSLNYGTRLGGKLASSSTGSNTESANIRTNFTFAEKITQVEILGVTTFGTAANLGNIALQVSTDGTTWTTVGTATVSATITFADLDIASGSYLRVAIDLVASGSNSGLQFTGLQVTGIKA